MPEGQPPLPAKDSARDRQGDLLPSLIKILPNLGCLLLVVLVLIWFRVEIQRDLLPRLTGIKAFGFEAAFIEKLNAASTTILPGTTAFQRMSKEEGKALEARAKQVLPLLCGKSVLWVDDNPENDDIERGLLESLGVSVWLARSTETAVTRTASLMPDLIISDIAGSRKS